MKLRLAALLLVIAASTNVQVCAGNCGIKPIKPIAPIGCRDLVAQCSCDEQGENCSWAWVCVK